MKITDERFDKLSERVNDQGERLAKLEGGKSSEGPQKSLWPVWATVISSVLTLLVCGVGVALHLNTTIDSVKGYISGLGTKLDHVSDLVTELSHQQSEQTQKTIREFLATAQSTSIPGIAARATLAAASLTATLTKEKQNAPPEFFSATIDSLDSLEPKVGSEVFAARRALADYRSAIFHPSNLATIFAPGSKEGLSIEDLESTEGSRFSHKGIYRNAD